MQLQCYVVGCALFQSPLFSRWIRLEENSNPELIYPSAVARMSTLAKEPCKPGETWHFSANDVSELPPQSANLSWPLICF